MVGSNRVAAAQKLLAESPVDVIVSDDGWQHWALGRDLVIEVVDAARGYGNGHCLPAGPLREAAIGLPNADLTLYNGTDFSLKPIVGEISKRGSACRSLSCRGACVRWRVSAIRSDFLMP